MKPGHRRERWRPGSCGRRYAHSRPTFQSVTGGTLRMVRLTLTSLLLLDPATSSWRLPLST
jgi:hypothetical protein